MIKNKIEMNDNNAKCFFFNFSPVSSKNKNYRNFGAFVNKENFHSLSTSKNGKPIPVFFKQIS